MMDDNAETVRQVAACFMRWTDKDLQALKAAIDAEEFRRWMGDELEVKAKAAEHMHGD